MPSASPVHDKWPTTRSQLASSPLMASALWRQNMPLDVRFRRSTSEATRLGWACWLVELRATQDPYIAVRVKYRASPDQRKCRGSNELPPARRRLVAWTFSRTRQKPLAAATSCPLALRVGPPAGNPFYNVIWRAAVLLSVLWIVSFCKQNECDGAATL